MNKCLEKNGGPLTKCIAPPHDRQHAHRVDGGAPSSLTKEVVDSLDVSGGAP